MRESCDPGNRNYHITTRDIAQLHWIVENKEIWFNENDAISLQVWTSNIQQDGGEALLKDILDPPPLGAGLCPEVFVRGIQTKFQKDQFQKLGSNFVSIDATHNTTEYKGLNLFTIIVRDFWGHGMLCGAFPHLDTYSFPLHRCSCCMDANIKQHGSDNTMLFEFRKIVEPGDHARDCDE